MIQPKRQGENCPLFHIKFAMQDVPIATVVFDGLDISSSKISSGMTDLDIVVIISSSNGEITGTLEYADDVFRKPFIDRILKQYTVVLDEICDDPTRPL